MLKYIDLPKIIYPKLIAKCECNNRTWKEISNQSKVFQ